MRTKRLYNIITFHTTSGAMAMEKLCETNNIPGRLIPVPREISAGCGLAWRILADDFKLLEEYLISENTIHGEKFKITAPNFEIEVEQIVQLEL